LSQFLSFFNVNTIFFTILEYPMSYIEFIGTLFYLASVILIAQKKMITWPIGIISVILYGILFYQIQLYSDTIEQIYYLGASVYGWIFWKKNNEENKTHFHVSKPKTLLIWCGSTLFISLIVTVLMLNIHNILPTIFPAPASFPFWDALTTVMSFVAMFLMARKRVESWVYWIIVDIIGIILYFVKDVKFISLLYVILLFITIRGAYKWYKDSKSEAVS
jgi:nicotinamide mononucleotide transporter